MKFGYKFSNLLGTVYRRGNLVFTPDGNSVISPVGNKITIYDLKNNKSQTLAVESRYNYRAIDISPNGLILVAVSDRGYAELISLVSRTVIHKHYFDGRVTSVKFSPDGKYLAVCKGDNAFIFRVPGTFTGEFHTFEMIRVFHHATQFTRFVDWTSDSKVLAVGSKDMTVRLYPIEKFANFKLYSLGSHRTPIIACFFEKDSLDISTLSSDGQLCFWECNIDLDGLRPADQPVKKPRIAKDTSDSEDDIIPTVKELNDEESVVTKIEEEAAAAEDNESESKEKLYYKRISRQSLCSALKKEHRRAKLKCAAYHKDSHLLVTGFSTGAFFIHEMPSVTMIQSLSVTEHKISAISLNSTGDWLALGSPTLGQLLVWEWQSETFVMKQQGHINNITCLTHSPDGMYIATGGFDGKVKLWNTISGFCFVTFTEHTCNITALQFGSNRKFVISASLDGTVRAFDMTRYRNFKTFTSPRPVQFASLAIDSSGEFVAAGGQDVFEIYLWSMKIGRLCEILAGHEGPVTGLAFNPALGSTALASASWDKTLRLWNAVETGSQHEVIHLTSDALAVAYRPDGEEVAVTTLDGQISFFNVKHSEQTSYIEGRNDLGGTVSDTDLVSAKKNLESKAFTCICYSADGSCVLAGGKSKHVCIYNVKESILLKKFEITQNRSLDGVDDYINRRKLTEFGNKALIEKRGGAIKLPGVREGDMGTRSFRPEIHVYSLEFSPTGQAWAAATTEGVLVYSLDIGMVFDPFQLDVGITPDTVREVVASQDFPKALMMSIKLGEKALVQYVLESVPYSDIQLCVASLADVYIVRCAKHIVAILENSKHLEFYLCWIRHLLTTHGMKLKDSESSPVLMALQKNLTKCYEEVGKICDFNKYTMQFLSRIGDLKPKKETLMDVDSDELMSS